MNLSLYKEVGLPSLTFVLSAPTHTASQLKNEKEPAMKQIRIKIVAIFTHNCYENCSLYSFLMFYTLLQLSMFTNCNKLQQSDNLISCIFSLDLLLSFDLKVTAKQLLISICINLLSF